MNLKLSKSFVSPHQVKYLLFFDFDETYYPHACTPEQLKSLSKLEDFLNNLAAYQSVKIGWVTGSDLQQLVLKMKRAQMVYSPHFIASSLGTEVYDVSEKGELHPNKDWQNRLQTLNFSSSLVKDLVSELNQLYGIKLIEQTQLGQQRYKLNYYYFIRSETQTSYDLTIIRHLANINGVGLNINRCNPQAGDPAGAFDVDFIPLQTGKKEIVQFMMTQNNVPLANTIAFGDSGNDIEMLQSVQHGYLVGNATSEAKKLYPQVTLSHYAEGIVEVLKSLHFD